MKTEKLTQLLMKLGLVKKSQEVKSELYEVVEETQTKRKRGRPKKKDVPVPEVLPKRKRGRTRKNTKVIIEKRKRGRPRKISEEVIDKLTFISQGFNKAKKRGRPSKFSIENLQKKGVGRPRKFSVDILTKPELEIVPVLINILEKSQKPVHTDKLVSQINSIINFGSSAKSMIAEPTLRKVINYIRAKSLSPIVSVNGTGYEISLSKRKIKAQIESLNKRASSIVSSAHGLKKFL